MAIKNPFNFTDKFVNPNRNTFDISYQNNLTFNIGKIVPVQCLEVLPKTTVSYDTTLGLTFMPLIFPVQTRMRAEVKSFYVRNRTLWKDWQDFIGKTKDGLVPPYLSKNTSIKTGSLSDYLNLSTTLYGSRFVTTEQNAICCAYQTVRIGSNKSQFTYNIGDTISSRYATVLFDDEFKSAPSSNTIAGIFNKVRNAYLNKQDSVTNEGFQLAKDRFPVINDNLVPDSVDKNPISVISNEFKFTVDPSYFGSTITSRQCLGIIYFDSLKYSTDESVSGIPLVTYFSPDTYPERCYVRYKDKYNTIQITEANLNVSNGSYTLIYNGEFNPDTFSEIIDCILYINCSMGDHIHIEGEVSNEVPSLSSVSLLQTRSVTKAEIIYKTDGLPVEPLGQFRSVNPYYDKDTNPDGETITCLAHRAYEAIYNYWYRDSRNNPRIVNGEPVYNSFITTDEGGEDDTDYHLFDDNWEQDFLTTAVQSPQQGVAPLVGITSYGEFSFKDEEGNHYSAQATFDSDGDTITGFSVLSPDMPAGNRRQLVDMASYGISISDLRNVNALQRWLEINMRRGLRYQDQIKSHFGVDVKYKDYMYPEFIGGHNEEIYIKEVDQTVPTNETPLGWKAGQATSFGKSRNRVTHFCDEHGFIITCVVVKPVANYSQIVPKHFYKRDTLDYYFPEFGHLSMQAIPYREVAPIQAVNEFGLSKLKETFGYQRAWYEYFNKTDEVHGLFRTNLRNFVVQRQFTSLPELSNDFLTVHNEELDDIFAVSSSDVDHKIIGQIYFDYQIKLPIPKYGIPRLEA